MQYHGVNERQMVSTPVLTSANTLRSACANLPAIGAHHDVLSNKTEYSSGWEHYSPECSSVLELDLAGLCPSDKQPVLMGNSDGQRMDYHHCLPTHAGAELRDSPLCDPALAAAASWDSGCCGAYSHSQMVALCDPVAASSNLNGSDISSQTAAGPSTQKPTVASNAAAEFASNAREITLTDDDWAILEEMEQAFLCEDDDIWASHCSGSRQQQQQQQSPQHASGALDAATPPPPAAAAAAAAAPLDVPEAAGMQGMMFQSCELADLGMCAPHKCARLAHAHCASEAAAAAAAAAPLEDTAAAGAGGLELLPNNDYPMMQASHYPSCATAAAPAAPAPAPANLSVCALPGTDPNVPYYSSNAVTAADQAWAAKHYCTHAPLVATEASNVAAHDAYDITGCSNAILNTIKQQPTAAEHVSYTPVKTAVATDYCSSNAATSARQQAAAANYYSSSTMLAQKSAGQDHQNDTSIAAAGARKSPSTAAAAAAAAGNTAVKRRSSSLSGVCGPSTACQRSRVSRPKHDRLMQELQGQIAQLSESNKLLREKASSLTASRQQMIDQIDFLTHQWQASFAANAQVEAENNALRQELAYTAQRMQQQQQQQQWQQQQQAMQMGMYHR